MPHRDPDPLGPWDAAALSLLEGWDPAWASACREMSANPWTGGVLPPRLVELVSVALSVACTRLDRTATRRHVRAALDAGATRDEILTIVKMATVMAIHSCSLGAPILIEEAAAAGASSPARPDAPTPACDRMKAMGQWNTAWDPFFALDPEWTDQFMAAGAGIYGGGVFSPKETELLSIAFDASFTHMYAPGTRRHIRGALAAGASLAEVMEVLKLCVAQGVAASNLGVPILAEELRRREAAR
ncbi:carboxymuconolactone decarboxylase family protein [uncultured Amaricoccus sp.]|uniref:carboxymuconolactone decarboxylase family protein n=1 Tax=uncultured Amaricoccus sp. TaxID=339341 RepID=UPI002622AC39|nr:carboxymuconolactone decarboxylase family protein [uncultured Amaricoccus sp.]